MEKFVKLTETVQRKLHGVMLLRYIDLLWSAAYVKTDGLNVGDIRTSYKALAVKWGVSVTMAKKTVERFVVLDLATVTAHSDGTIVHLKQFDGAAPTNKKPRRCR